MFSVSWNTKIFDAMMIKKGMSASLDNENLFMKHKIYKDSIDCSVQQLRD